MNIECIGEDRGITFERCFFYYSSNIAGLFCVINSNYFHLKVVQMIAALTLNMLIVFLSSSDFLSAALKLFLFDDYTAFVCVCLCIQKKRSIIENIYAKWNALNGVSIEYSRFQKHSQFNFMAGIAFWDVWRKKWTWE